jgi:hypothetical protein
MIAYFDEATFFQEGKYDTYHISGNDLKMESFLLQSSYYCLSSSDDVSVIIVHP